MVEYHHISRSTLYAPVPGSDRLVIFFSGRLAGFKVDKFSFRTQSEALTVNRLFLRDCFGLWYQSGLKEQTNSISSTAAYLRGVYKEGGFSKVTTVGISSGGYAALLFGALIGAQAIHSLAPRTLLHLDSEGHADRNRYGVQKSLAKLSSLPQREEVYFDLRSWLESNPVTAENCSVYYDPEHSLDKFHAERLNSVPGITLVARPGEGHAMGKYLVADPGFHAQLNG